MCLCMLFACAGMMTGCSDSNNNEPSEPPFYEWIEVLSADTLSFEDGTFPDSTTVRATMEGFTVLINIENVHIRGVNPINIGGQIFVIPKESHGQINIDFCESPTQSQTSSLSDYWISFNSRVNIPKQVATHLSSISFILYNGVPHLPEDRMSITLKPSMDLNKTKEMTWKIPLLTIKSPDENEAKE